MPDRNGIEELMSMLRDVLEEKKEKKPSGTFASQSVNDLKKVVGEALSRVNDISRKLIHMNIFDVAYMPGVDDSLFVVMPDASTVIITFKPLSANATQEFIDDKASKMKNKEEENAK